MKTQYDVVIIGTGAAGLYGALQFNNKTNILLISKKELPLSNSSLAQGGVAAVLDKKNDKFELHMDDTLIAGKYKNNKEAIKVLVSEGPDDVRNLKKMGVDFDLDDNGNLKMTLEAGHSRHRIVYHKDSTGKEIVNTLIENVKKNSNIDIIDCSYVYTIEKAKTGFSIGIIDEKTNKSEVTAAKYCMLCSGGIGKTFKYTTNSAIASGDGIRMAYELGAKIKNLHYIQFHPTAFAGKECNERFLISEAVRGEGAVLLNCNGERFVSNYDKRGELAPRDVVSDAIIKEMHKTGSDHFYLDITSKGAEFVKNRFPMIYEKCLEDGIDITKDKIPVFPCQHYLMGGIDVDLYARTTVDRLYAAGECSHTGVHGANRLASNSLLEALVFSRRAAEDITKRLGTDDNSGFCDSTMKPVNIQGDALPEKIRDEIREIIQSTFFVVVNKEKLNPSLNRIKDILNELQNNNYAHNCDYYETKSIATMALIILSELKEKYDV